MPERENIPGRVHVAVVSDTALTDPFPYSKPCDTSRPAGGQCTATATGLGGVRLVHDPEDDACVRAFVGQHRFQLTPAGIEHRLGHPGSDEFLRADIAPDDHVAALDQRAAEFVQGILAPVGYLGVDCPHPSFLARTLGAGQLGLQVAVETAILQPLPVATGGHVLQAQVDANGPLPRR